METGTNAVAEPVEPPKVEIKVVEKANMKGKDAYQRHELNMPFARVECIQFWEVTVRAHAACGSEGFVTAASLREQLTDEHWADLDKPDSNLVHFLQSKYFKDEEADPQQTEE